MVFLGLLEKKILNESASVENVAKAMDNRSKVIINYYGGEDDNDGNDNYKGPRIIEPVAYGLSKASNPVIRAYQIAGGNPGWKFFRLDKISYWEETNEPFGKRPDFNMSELNQYGDNSMSVVFKTYNDTNVSAVNNINVGPKTKSKIAASTYGDSKLSLGKNNLERIKNNIKIDLENNKKAQNGFKTTTNDTSSNDSGPKPIDNGKKQYQPKNVNGSVENGDINPKDLEKAREEVYGFDTHGISDDQYFRDAASVNPNDMKSQQRRDKTWNNSSDSRFLNRKDSWNRDLYNMENDNDDDE